MEGGGAPDVDVHELFCHYNALYFDDSLGACAVSWTSDPLPSGASDCEYYLGGGCDILLSKPVLRDQSVNCLKNVLLHEMIHAYMCIHHGNRDRSDHGQKFQIMMNSINSGTVNDHKRPADGYSIIMSHEIPKEVICENSGSRLQEPAMLKDRGMSSKDDSPSSSYNPSKRVKRINEFEPAPNSLAAYHSEKSAKNYSPTQSKKRKLNKDYAVIIEWLEVFTDEESDGEAPTPLINKRTVRRKKQKCSDTEVGAPSSWIENNESRFNNDLEKHGTEVKLVIDDSLDQIERMPELASNCRNEVVEVPDC